MARRTPPAPKREPRPGDVVLSVPWGSRFARAWLAAFHAAEHRDDARPALYRTLLIHRYDDGFQLVATDAYWIAAAWCGDEHFDADLETNVIAPPPGRGELPRWSLAVQDPDLRVRGLMGWVRARTREVTPDKPDLRVRVTLRLDHDDDRPRLDPSLDLTVVDVDVPGVEAVTGVINDAEFPDVARLMWAHDPELAVEVDHVQLSPRLLRKLASACTDADAGGVRFDFHGDPTRPISWEAAGAPLIKLTGVVMPQRVPGDDPG